jgi:hypothetical protein
VGAGRTSTLVLAATRGIELARSGAAEGALVESKVYARLAREFRAVAVFT